MNSNKMLLAALAASVAISSVAADACTGQNLVTSSNLTTGSNILTASIATDKTVSYCPTLVSTSSQICCNAATLNNLQDKTTAVKNTMTAEVILRDNAFLIAANATANAQSTFTGYTAALSTFTNNVTATYNGSANATAELNEFLGIITALNDVLVGGNGTTPAAAILEFTNELSEIDFSFADFQTARSTCAVELLKLQGAVWCLACNPLASTNGYTPTGNSQGVDLADATCARLSDACYNYVITSQLQNGIFQIWSLVTSFQVFTTVLKNANARNLASIETAFETALLTATNGFYAGFATAEVPAGCDDVDSCQDWICSNFFNQATGAIDIATFLIGGEEVDMSGDDDSVRRLAGSRKLGGTYAPAANEAGTTVTFPTDPAGVADKYAAQYPDAPGNNSGFGSLGFGSVAAGIMMVTGAMML